MFFLTKGKNRLCHAAYLLLFFGELVRTFNLGLQTQGEKKFHWDGKNVKGESVASGVYFYQFDAGNTQIVRKMWLMK